MALRWEDERYVRFYTRNAPEWRALSWRARGLFGLILREVDRAGILQVGRLGLKGVAVAVDAPWSEVEDPLNELIADGCVRVSQNMASVYLPNFIEAQEAAQSDVARKRASREKARANVTIRDFQESQNVTKSHVGSHAVTFGHSVPSVPSRTKPSLKEHTGDLRAETEPRLDPNAPDLGQAANATERKVVDRWVHPALEILEALSEARKRVIPKAHRIRPTYTALAGIANRLEAGRTAAECLAVIENCEAECRIKPDSCQYFDAISPWRPENFERKLSMAPISNGHERNYKNFASPMQHVTETREEKL